MPHLTVLQDLHSLDTSLDMFIAKRCFLSDSQLPCATANAYPIRIGIYPICTGGCPGSYCRIPPPQKTEMRPMPYLKLLTMISSTSLCISLRKLFFKYSLFWNRLLACYFQILLWDEALYSQSWFDLLIFKKKTGKNKQTNSNVTKA